MAGITILAWAKRIAAETWLFLRAHARTLLAAHQNKTAAENPNAIDGKKSEITAANLNGCESGCVAQRPLHYFPGQQRFGQRGEGGHGVAPVCTARKALIAATILS